MGPRADSEDAADGIELIGERGDGARKVARQLVAGKTRAIVIGDAEGDLGSLAREARVMTTHDALQGRKLDDRVGDEVGLAQQRGAHDVIALGTRDTSGVADSLGVLHDAHGLVVDASELLLEHDALQAIDITLEWLAAILDHEEGRVIETGAHDALVACDDGLGIGGIAIAHDEKRVVERAIGLIHREVALMLEHRVGDDLGRDVKETLIEVREHDGGIFDEVHDLVEGALGGIGLETRLGLDGVDLTTNGLCALLRTGDDLHLLVGNRQVGGIRKLELPVGHEAIAARDAARNQPGVLDGTTSSPYRAMSQRTGREKVT